MGTIALKLKNRARHLSTKAQRKLSKASAIYMSMSFGLPSLPLSKIVPGEDSVLVPKILDRICLPPYHGPEHDDFTPLMKIARHLNPRAIVELGTAHGNTVANLCVECPMANIVTVNSPSAIQSGELTTFELTPEEIGSVYGSYGFNKRVTQILANTLTLDLSEYLEPASVDLAIIDACHDTDYVVNDFHKVHRYIRPGGCVLFHDTHPSMAGHLAGSYVACMKLRKEGFEVRHIDGTWWGIWQQAIGKR